MADENSTDLIEITGMVAASYFENNRASVDEIATVISAIHSALKNLGEAAPAAEPAADEFKKPTPGQIRKSITPDALVSFEDGRPYKTLKRHLSTRGLSVADYKAKWGLPSDYPSVAPNYSAARSAMAKSLGLGQQGRKAKAATRSRKPRAG